MSITAKWLMIIAAVTLLPSVQIFPQAPQTPNDISRADRDRNNRLEQDLQNRMDKMRDLDNYARRRSEADKRPAPQPPALDKHARERMLAMRQVDPQDLQKYAAFLADEATGIFKLFPNLNCVSRNLIRVDGKCAAFVPESSDFSFRQNAYMVPEYHDIGFTEGGFVTNGFFAQGIIASLGNTPLPDVSIGHPAVKTLIDIAADTKFADARKSAKRFSRTVEENGYTYSDRADMAENTTYVLRNIAYKLGNTLAMPTADSPMIEMKLLSLRYDKREDVTVAFRVVRVGDDGGITVIWKELQRKDAPKLVFQRDEPLSDIRR